MTITPNAMPRKANPVHQQLLSGLIATKPTTRTHKVLERDGEGKEVISETKIVGTTLAFPLANNVSEENVDRMARRWIA